MKKRTKEQRIECSVFTTYRNFWDKIRLFPEDIKCIYQRVRYGYCYRDVWSIDSWFLRVMQNMIRDLRDTTHGYPGCFDGPEKENVKRWNDILTKMADYFQDAHEETCRRTNPYEEESQKAWNEFEKKYGSFGSKLAEEEAKNHPEKKSIGVRLYTPGDVPEYKDVIDKYVEEERAIFDYRDACMKEGMKMFTEYFWNLWDQENL